MVGTALETLSPLVSSSFSSLCSGCVGRMQTCKGWNGVDLSNQQPAREDWRLDALEASASSLQISDVPLGDRLFWAHSMVDADAQLNSSVHCPTGDSHLPRLRIPSDRYGHFPSDRCRTASGSGTARIPWQLKLEIHGKRGSRVDARMVISFEGTDRVGPRSRAHRVVLSQQDPVPRVDDALTLRSSTGIVVIQDYILC